MIQTAGGAERQIARRARLAIEINRGVIQDNGRHKNPRGKHAMGNLHCSAANCSHKGRRF
jgi:hypothetical protein